MESATCLVTHVISGKKTKIGFGGMFRITTLKVVKLGMVCEGIVAVLSRESKYIGVIRSAGTLRGVWEEESCTTSKENINNWS